MPDNITRIRAEALGYWYLRLNGFLTIPNFVVHPEQGRNQETDVDILGVRCPFRAELRTMKDDVPFNRIRGKSFVAIAEIKTGPCALNGPWTNPDRQNMHKVLRALGAFHPNETEVVAAALYERGVYQSQLYHASLVCLGREENPDLAEKYPGVPQISWHKALLFIYERFNAYRRQKESHGQWNEDGRNLWNAFERSRDSDDFVGRVRVPG